MPYFPNQYRGLLPQLHRVYLDELSIDPTQAIAVNIAELVIANEDVAIETAKVLIVQTRQQIDDLGFQKMAIAFVNDGSLIFSDLILHKSKKTEVF